MAGNTKKRKKKNEEPFDRTISLLPNIGLIIFGILLVYVIIYFIIYVSAKRIERYEVREGSLTVSNIYTGIALREEEVVNNNSAGYINFFIYEGERAAVGDLVYTVDETGRLETATRNEFEESSLSDRELREFRSEIINYMHGFQETSFESIYDFKHSLRNTITRITSGNLLNSLEELKDTDVVKYCNAQKTGVVTYWTDGFEKKTAAELTQDDFKKDRYNRTQVIGGELLEMNVPAYKLCTSELWDIVIPVDPERGEELNAEGYIKVRFLKNQYESWASTDLIRSKDGSVFLKLSFNNSMVTFVSDRFLDIELLLEQEQGLKIPNTAIVEKNFYLIDEEFLIDEGRKGKRTMIRQCYLEDGSISTETRTIDIYSYDEENGRYYVDSDVLNTGDVLHKPDTQKTCTVSEWATLIGVYNINKGYADFKEIKILYQNDEYSVVRSGTEYGLKVYDYIVLNADKVYNQEFINQ